DARGLSWPHLLGDRRGILPAAASLGRGARQYSGRNPLLLPLEAGGLSTAADPASGRRRHDSLTSPRGPGRGQDATRCYVFRLRQKFFEFGIRRKLLQIMKLCL